MTCFLVVGGAGYIGSHMVLALEEAGHRVVVLDDLSRGHRAAVPDGTLVEGDLGDEELVARLTREQRIECALHFAAHSLVGESVRRPLDYWDNNVGRTVRLVRALLAGGVRRLIFSSTAAVYGEPERVPIREDAPTTPGNPYGRSKLAIEQVLEDAERAHGLRHVSLRYFNAAGADASGRIGEDHEPETHLIPLVLQVALGMRERVQIFGTDYETPDGTCVRDYVHVSDLAQAHLLAADHLLSGGASAVYNLGCEAGISVREIIGIARRVTGQPIPAVEVQRRPGDPARLVASSERIRADLGWVPRFGDTDSIVESAWRWHRAHPRGYQPQIAG